MAGRWRLVGHEGRVAARPAADRPRPAPRRSHRVGLRAGHRPVLRLDARAHAGRGRLCARLDIRAAAGRDGRGVRRRPGGRPGAPGGRPAGRGRPRDRGALGEPRRGHRAVPAPVRADPGRRRRRRGRAEGPRRRRRPGSARTGAGTARCPRRGSPSAPRSRGRPRPAGRPPGAPGRPPGRRRTPRPSRPAAARMSRRAHSRPRPACARASSRSTGRWPARRPTRCDRRGAGRGRSAAGRAATLPSCPTSRQRPAIGHLRRGPTRLATIGRVIDKLPLRPELSGIEPYGAPQLRVPVVLNVNENPYPPSDAVVAEIAAAVTAAASTLNRYPDRELMALRTDLAAYLLRESGVALEPTQVWAANGSNEVMLHLLQAFGGPGRTVVSFAPTYSMLS